MANDRGAAAVCPICGRANEADALFCCGCVAPLRVEKLSGLSPADLQLCLNNLLEALLSGRHALGIVSAPQGGDELLRAYLSAFWLRPESALLQCVETRIVQEILDEFYCPPFLDVGCGNGVHTSLLLGCRFADEFDVYHDLDLEAADIYDAVPQRPFPVEIVRRGRRIDYGVDIKRSMVERARLLGTFERVLEADAVSLPLDDSEVGCIYSNVIRDFNDIILDMVLRECARVLRSGGYLILSSPTETYRDKLFYFPRAMVLREQGNNAMADQYLRLDRGRSIFCRQQVPLANWEERLARCGFVLIDSVPFARRPLLELWDSGLRPFSPLLFRWAKVFKQSESFVALKREIVSAMEAILYPFFVAESEVQDGGFRVLLARKLQV